MDLLISAVFLYLLGCLTLLLPHNWQKTAHWLSNSLAMIASVIVVFVSAKQLLLGDNMATIVWGPYSLGCDNWSAIFLLLTGISGTITSLYALGYAKSYEGKRLRLLGSMWNLFLLSMVLVLLANDAFSFLLFWEMMAVSSFMLVNHECDQRSTWTSAYQYLVMTSIGTTSIMIAFLLIASASPSFSFIDMGHNNLNILAQHFVFVCAFIGFGLKAGLVPLHVWLPKAHPAAPSHVSALMSGVMLKIALYGFGRFMYTFLPNWNYWWCVAVMMIGLISAFLGVLYAQMETDIKRVLAYSSVENMGIVFAAFGCGMFLNVVVGTSWGWLGFLAALVHAFNHSIMKVLMFMGAGSIMHATGSKNMELFGGLAKKMPFTSIFIFIGSMALASLPLTNGFIGEWLLLQSFINLAQNSHTHDIRVWSSIAFILIGFMGALALGCFVRFFGVIFLGRARDICAVNAHESNGFMLLAMGIASFLVLAIGIYPIPLLKIVTTALNLDADIIIKNTALTIVSNENLAIFNPIILLILLIIMGLIVYLFVRNSFVTNDVTWNCGTYPTQRQQYSATGFSKPVRRAFDYMLKPKRKVTYMRKDNAYFGRLLSYKLEVPDMITEKLYLPFQKHFVSISTFLRKMQQGSVRLYVSYVMAAMVIVLVWGALYK